MCAACIQSSGSALSNVERIMTGPDGEAVGVKMRSADDVRNWIQAIELGHCHCYPIMNSFKQRYGDETGISNRSGE
jgi:hypothetical protein